MACMHAGGGAALRTEKEVKRSGSARSDQSCRLSPLSITMHGGSGALLGSTRPACALSHSASTCGRNLPPSILTLSLETPSAARHFPAQGALGGACFRSLRTLGKYAA